ncbi:MAG: ComF family protein [Burkholderiaceae bacterium]
MLFTRLLDTVATTPSKCAVCHDWGTQRVCAQCVARFAPVLPRCGRCGIEVPVGTGSCGACLTDPPPFERTLAGVDYAHPWDGLITQFKFHAALDLAPALSRRLLDAFHRGGGPAPALLLAIPLSAERLRERGYNQAWELARRLARALDGRADPSLLLRVKDTPHQLALAPDKRAGNVHAAFAVEPRRRAELAGATVTLVDDVMTTGATAAEAARVLLQAGAAQVHVWVVARTPRSDAV